MVRRGRAFWKKVVAEVVHRGVSYGEVARAHDVNVSTLRWWASTLRRESGDARARPAVRMLPVEIAPGPSAPAALEIRMTRGEVINFVEGTDVAYVAALVAALRGASC